MSRYAVDEYVAPVARASSDERRSGMVPWPGVEIAACARPLAWDESGFPVRSDESPRILVRFVRRLLGR